MKLVHCKELLETQHSFPLNALMENTIRYMEKVHC